MSRITCSRCKTAQYLHFKLIEEPDDRGVPGYVEYFCHSCGLKSGESTDEGWRMPATPPDIERLKERGDYWIDSRQHWKRDLNGGETITVGTGGL